MNHQCSNLYFRINFIGHAPLPWISPANTTIEAPKNVPIAFVILISEYSLQCFGSKWQSSSSRKRRDARPPAKNDRPRQPECKVMVLTHLGMTHADLAASTLHRHDSVMARAKLDSSLRHARENGYFQTVASNTFTSMFARQAFCRLILRRRRQHGARIENTLNLVEAHGF